MVGIANLAGRSCPASHRLRSRSRTPRRCMSSSSLPSQPSRRATRFDGAADKGCGGKTRQQQKRWGPELRAHGGRADMGMAVRRLCSMKESRAATSIAGMVRTRLRQGWGRQCCAAHVHDCAMCGDDRRVRPHHRRVQQLRRVSEVRQGSRDRAVRCSGWQHVRRAVPRPNARPEWLQPQTATDLRKQHTLEMRAPARTVAERRGKQGARTPPTKWSGPS